MKDTFSLHIVTRHSLQPLRLSVVLLAVFISLSSHADDNRCVAWQPGGAEALESNSGQALVFGRITIRTGDLFDLSRESENAFVHSAANSLHLNTRQGTVFNALPFAEGDVFSVEKMLEAERILRGKRYLRDALVTAHRLCENRVDVEVRTVDNWTLTPSASFGSAGGQTRYSFEIQDMNVLGLGKEFTLRNSRSGDEQKTLFQYGDDNVLGSRYRLGVQFSDMDGEPGYSLEFGLPFYSQVATHAWQISANESTRSLSSSGAYDDQQVPELSLQSTRFELQFSKRLPDSDLPTARLGGGIRIDQEQTLAAIDGQDIDSATDYQQAYPFLSAQWSESRWVKRQNYIGIRNIEDIDLGLSVSAEAGLILRGLGNEEDTLRLSIDLDKGWYAGNSSLHNFSFHQLQYFGSRELERKEISVRYQFFYWLSDVDQLDLRLSAQMRDGFSAFDNFAVGGADGLRGYPTRFQVGGRRVLGVAEYRHITAWSPWSLVNTAVTGFIEGGRAWSEDEQADTLANIGVGLLLAPTRSSRSAVNRFDIAVPLSSNEDLDAFQIFIGTQINF
ncbi:hypothetical protein [Granulosicoccus antarcticus]|nr:hypothetical protein [Granulosicoccus antarcticus]